MAADRITLADALVRRWLVPEPFVCERIVSRLRAEQGTAAFPIEQSLRVRYARRMGLATALPLPTSGPWSIVSWLIDTRVVARQTGSLAACIVYAHDPDFFRRAGWPRALVDIMLPVDSQDPDAAAALVALGLVLQAAGRSRARRAAVRRGWGPSRRALTALGWGHVEARGIAKLVCDGVQRHLDRVTRERAASESADVVTPVDVAGGRPVVH